MRTKRRETPLFVFLRDSPVYVPDKPALSGRRKSGGKQTEVNRQEEIGRKTETDKQASRDKEEDKLTDSV